MAEVTQVTVRPMRQRRGSILEATISDGQSSMSLTFFNQQWRERQLTVRAARPVRGAARAGSTASGSWRTPSSSCCPTASTTIRRPCSPSPVPSSRSTRPASRSPRGRCARPWTSCSTSCRTCPTPCPRACAPSADSSASSTPCARSTGPRPRTTSTRRSSACASRRPSCCRCSWPSVAPRRPRCRRTAASLSARPIGTPSTRGCPSTSRTGSARSARRSTPTWSATIRCTGCSRATSAAARRSSPCGPCSGSSTPGGRRPCSRPPRCSRPSTTGRSARCSARSPRRGGSAERTRRPGWPS